MSTAITPSVLFKTAALISAISVPGHIVFGLDTVHPVLKTIKIGNKKTKAGHASATACFNYVNGALAILALLNWKWAVSGGPATREERLILWVSVVNGFIDGWTYLRAGEYAPLLPMWIAPAASVAAHLISS